MPIKAILFDFMGTCLDWHTAITSTLPSSIPQRRRSDFALRWRQTYFDINDARRASGLPPENIDVTHLAALECLLSQPDFQSLETLFDTSVKARCIEAWHRQPAWPDVLPALQTLKSLGHEIFVHANGTVRLQLDLCASSGLRGHFDMLFSSQLLGYIKPDPRAYEKFLALTGLKAEECVMVAAHAYDVRGAREVGMKTVYVYRWTDDIKEDQEIVKGENDAYLEDMTGLSDVVARL